MTRRIARILGGGIPAAPDAARLTGRRLLARNTWLTLIGEAAPMGVALFAIPHLIDGLGTARFGVLTLAWVVIGYFGLLDLGLGRALTKLVAEKLGTGAVDEVPALVWTGFVAMLAVGVAGMLVIAGTAPWLVGRVLEVPPELHQETTRAFLLLGLSVPLVIGTAGLRGVLEAQQRFGWTNAARVPLSALSYLGPLMVLPFSRSLVPVVAVLAAGRALGLVVHLVLCVRVTPGLGRRVALRRAAVGPLFRCGSWMTVSNVVSPVMVSMDRFLIGALVSMSAVAYYATPYEVVTRLLVIPAAVVKVFFPAFSTSFAARTDEAAALFERGSRYVFLPLFPVTLLVVVAGPPALELWLGAEFAAESAAVLQWLALGIFANGLGLVPFSLVQGAGRPDLTAKLHLAELPLYLAAVWALVGAFGIRGAAIAWTARAALDTVVLYLIAWRMLGVRAAARRRLLIAGALSFALLALAFPRFAPVVRVPLVATILVGFGSAVVVRARATRAVASLREVTASGTPGDRR